tara:strand:+ start:715 stop:1176 length:462 start_codon:yes stop_codon:yes gene_type:complete
MSDTCQLTKRLRRAIETLKSHGVVSRRGPQKSLLDWVERTTGVRPSSSSLNDQANGRGKINPWLLLTVEALAEKAEMSARLHKAVDTALHDRFDKGGASSSPDRVPEHVEGLVTRFAAIAAGAHSASAVARLERMLDIAGDEVVQPAAEGKKQ